MIYFFSFLCNESLALYSESGGYGCDILILTNSQLDNKVLRK